jgi:drug/metabolite transporter (DMT)-like permease
LLLSAVCLPGVGFFSPIAAAPFWTNLVIAAGLAVACNTLLVAAVRDDDLSILGPINSFKPLVSLGPSLWLLGERPGALGLTGIGLIVVGSYALVGGVGGTEPGGHWIGLFRRRGVQLRVAALVLSGIEAVFLKRALLAADPATTFIWWSILGLAFAGIALPFIPHRETERDPTMSARPRTTLMFGLALTTGIMQYSTLVTFATAPVASALALFQLSSILSVLLGHRLFHEPHVVRRLIASTVMAFGAALLVLDR